MGRLWIPDEVKKCVIAGLKAGDSYRKIHKDVTYKNKFGKMPYRIFRADENGPEIVEIGEGILLPDEDNYLYDPSTNTVVSDHYDRVFTCFRYMVSAIKK